MEMFDLFWETKMYYAAVLNLVLLTVLGSLYTGMVALVWRVIWGGPVDSHWSVYYSSQDGAVPVSYANCASEKMTRFGGVVGVVLGGVVVVVVVVVVIVVVVVLPG